MAFSVKRRIYEGLPEWLKRPAGWVPFSVLAGQGYRRTVARGRELDRASREVLTRYQAGALGRMLDFATREVPAYQPMRGLVERLPPFEALKGFPFLAKEDLQNDIEKYLPRSFDRIPHYECTTGGTTGNQLKFFVDDDSQAVEMGFMHRQWARVGYSPRSRKATFRGVAFPRASEGVLWQENPVYNEIQFSPFHMNDENLDRYFWKMRAFQPEFLHGYPSAISLVAEFARRNPRALEGIPLRAVLLGSEALFPDQRERIENALGARVYSWYGHSERLILAGECEKTTAYHHFPDYGVVEIVKDDGTLAARPEESGELVGTGLLNRSLPMMRYRTGDRARLLAPACSCGRFFDRFDEVAGRWDQEYVLGSTGSRISTAALNMHGSFFDRVKRYQYVQEEKGKMEIRVLPGEGFSEADSRAIVSAYEKKCGAELEVFVKVVDDIRLTPRGKARRLIQKLPGV